MSKKILTLDNVPVINKKIGKIDTIEKLKASTIYSLGDVVEVLGFHAKGDGSHHKRIAKAEDDGSGELGQGGIWWCVVHSGEVNVSWFGARGDGVTDDTTFIQRAIDYTNLKNIKIVLNCGHLITNTLEINSQTHIENNAFNVFDIPWSETPNNSNLLFRSNEDIPMIRINKADLSNRSNSCFLKFSAKTYKSDGSLNQNIVGQTGVEINKHSEDKYVDSKGMVLDLDLIGFGVGFYARDLIISYDNNIRTANCGIGQMFVKCYAGRVMGYAEGCCVGYVFSLCNFKLDSITSEYCYNSTPVSEDLLASVNCDKKGIGIFSNSSKLLIDSAYLEVCETASVYCVGSSNLNLISCQTELGKDLILFDNNQSKINFIGNTVVVPTNGTASKIFKKNIKGQSCSAIFSKNNHIVQEGSSFLMNERDYVDSDIFVDIPYDNIKDFDFFKSDTKIIEEKRVFVEKAYGDPIEIYDASSYILKIEKMQVNSNLRLQLPYKNLTITVDSSEAEEGVEYSYFTDFVNQQSFWVEFIVEGVVKRVIPKVSNLTTKFCISVKKINNKTYITKFTGDQNESVVQALDTPYYTLKMQQEGIYEDYITYRDELHEYENSQTSDETMLLPVLQEPVIPESVKAFAEKYKLI